MVKKIQTSQFSESERLFLDIYHTAKSEFDHIDSIQPYSQSENAISITFNPLHDIPYFKNELGQFMVDKLNIKVKLPKGKKLYPCPISWDITTVKGKISVNICPSPDIDLLNVPIHTNNCDDIMSETKKKNLKWIETMNNVSDQRSMIQRAYEKQKVIINPSKVDEGYEPKYAGIHTKMGEKRLEEMKHELHTLEEQDIVDRFQYERIRQYAKDKHCLKELGE